MKKQIKKLAKGRFNVSTLNIANSQLILDFNPIIQKFNLKGNFSLIHWQARPRGYREWGIYNSETDTYQSLSGFQMEAVFKRLVVLNEEPTLKYGFQMEAVFKRLVVLNEEPTLLEVIHPLPPHKTTHTSWVQY